jgi:MFS family permease
LSRPATFRSLGIRNYRLWFTGQVISVAGTWTQTVAQAVLILDLSHNNGVAAGAGVALQYLPTLLFSVWGGLLADRVDKRRLLMITQTVLATIALMLAILDLGGVITLWMVYVLVFMSGCATSLDQPVRQSFVTELVPPEDLPNAIGLNSTVFNSARMIGPAVAAAIILLSGTGGCFLVNAVSYIAILVGLARMDPTQLHRSAPLPRGRGQVRDGVRYAWSQPLLRANLLLMAMVGTFAFNFPVVFPLVARVTFGGGDGTVGMLFTVQGAGALVGALLIASVRRTDGRRLLLASVLLGVAMLGAAVAPSLGVLLLVMPFMGLGQIFTASSSNSMIQLDSEPSMRGRVTSLRTLTVLGSTPIGGLLTGVIAQAFSPRWSLAVGGIGCFVGVALGWSLLTDRTPQTPPPAEDVLETEPAAAT